MVTYPSVHSSESSDREIGYGKSENLFCIGKYLQEKCLAIFLSPLVLCVACHEQKDNPSLGKFLGLYLPTTVDPQLLLFLDKTRTFSRSISVAVEGSSGR